MASFRKLNNGWQARIFYYDNVGKRHSLSKNGFRTKKLAQKYAQELEYEYTQGGDLSNQNVVFSQYFLRWYQTFREPRLAPATRNNYLYTLKVIQKYFGTTLLKNITRADYQKFLNFIGKGDSTHPAHAKQTVVKINSHIRACVQNAINDGLIRENFTNNTHIVYDPQHTRGINYLNQAEAIKLLHFLKKNYSGVPPYAMAYLALMTGLRVSEVAGLTWDSIDKKHHTIRVYQSWNFNSKSFAPTKNEFSKRSIDYTPAVGKLFNRVRLEQNNMLMLTKQTNDKNLIFISSRRAEPYSVKVLEQYLKRALKEAHIKQDLTFHGLRHTHASLLLYKGIAIPFISKRLGHKNVNTTINIYLHIIQELQSEESHKTINYLNKLEQLSN